MVGGARHAIVAKWCCDRLFIGEAIAVAVAAIANLAARARG
jgi:hypothetical protein